MKLGTTGVWYFTESMPAPQAAEFAQRIEKLGYSTLWLPELMGRNPFVHAAYLFSQTSTLNIATGIANIYHRHPGLLAQSQKTLAELSGIRFLLGMGVSHAPIVSDVRGLEYGKPVATMRRYLEDMAKAPYMSVPPSEAPPTVIAALGPKMLELAGSDLADGAHPYWTTPEHTHQAREILGPDKLLCVEQKVCLETNPTAARAACRQAFSMYATLPNYANNWKRLGFSDADIADGGSDKIIDALVAWGDEKVIAERIQAHRDAGATHVCIQPLKSEGNMGDVDWAVLEACAPGA
jgi:probable F420-dependent oxidoreductase